MVQFYSFNIERFHKTLLMRLSLYPSLIVLNLRGAYLSKAPFRIPPYGWKLQQKSLCSQHYKTLKLVQHRLGCFNDYFPAWRLWRTTLAYLYHEGDKGEKMGTGITTSVCLCWETQAHWSECHYAGWRNNAAFMLYRGERKLSFEVN